MQEVFDNALKYLIEQKECIVKTGFLGIDNYFLKGHNSSSIITIAARPSMGKTLFSTNILLNLLEENK